MKERGAEGRERIEKDKYTQKIYRVDPLLSAGVVARQHALLYMRVHAPHAYLHISIYMRINLCPHICIYKRCHTLMHTHAPTHARAYALGCARVRMQDACERSCTGTSSP